MASILKKWFARTSGTPIYRVPAGQRVYAVGDIHGCLDLFERLIVKIEADDAARASANTTIILLGDLVDRGADSSGVIDTAIELSSRRNVRTLCGNHEEMFLRCLEDDKYVKPFLFHGGRETVLSYLKDAENYNTLTFGEVQKRLLVAVPAEHRDFLESLEDKVIVGDYLFVHAGVRPGVDLQDQTLADLRWIREPFLSFGPASAYCVIHGHTVTAEPVVKAGRIGIDTGAYQSGRLTAIGLEGDTYWFISAEAD